MYCNNCGKEIADNAEICVNCGCKIRREISEDEVMPSWLLPASIITNLCCCVPTGIAAIIYACKVNTYLAKGDIEGAKKAVRLAKIWTFVGVGLYILFWTAYFFFFFLAGMAEEMGGGGYHY